MAIQGIFASNQGIQGERVGDFASAILMTNPTGKAPLLGLTAGMPKESAQDTTFTWFEDAHESGRQACVSGGTTTTVVVADGSFYTPNTILEVQETGEHLFVTAAVGNSLTVVRGFAGTTVVSISGSHHVQKIGNAHEEGSAIPTPVTQQGAPRFNFVQIFRNAWAITGTAKAVKYLTGSKVAHNKQMCAMYHSEDIERSFIWGKKTLTTLNNKQFRTTDGILTQIETYGGTVETANSDDGGGATPGDLSRIDLEDFIQEIFAYNIKDQPNERITFIGNKALAEINKMSFLDGSYQFTQGETKMGIKVTTVQTPFGDLKLMSHAMMNENPIWTHEMYVLHPGGIKKRTLRDTFPENLDGSSQGTQGRDADEGVITSEMGIQVGAAKTMGIYRNIQHAIPSNPA
jgi:hypothetical protein